MQIKKTKNTKKLLMLIIAIAVVVLAAGAYFVFYKKPANNPSGMNVVNYGPATKNDQEAVDQHKQDLADDQTKEGGTPSTDTSLGATITRASQSAGQPLSVRVLIEGTQTGNCELTLTKSGQPTVTKTFPIKFEATTASCGAADVTVDSFSVSGQWKLAVIAKSGTHQSAPAEQTVTITK